MSLWKKLFGGAATPTPKAQSTVQPTRGGALVAAKAAESINVQQMAFRSLRENEFAWNDDLFVAFLNRVRSTVPAHLLSDVDVRGLVEDMRRRYCPRCHTRRYIPGDTEYALHGTELCALFSCGKCDEPQKLLASSISKTKGVDVLCSCGAITHVPPAVWCKTCGEGLSPDWQSYLLRKR